MNYTQLHAFLAVLYMVYGSFTHSIRSANIARQILASKGGIVDPDKPCHSTLGSTPSSSSSQ